MRLPLLLVAALAVLAGCTTGHGYPAANARPVRYPLTSNGWTPDEAYGAAGGVGVFHAALLHGHACAWLGDVQPVRTDVWPAGWTVRFAPTELIDAAGKVVPHEGDTVAVGGGVADVTSSPCGSARARGWSVAGPVTVW